MHRLQIHRQTKVGTTRPKICNNCGAFCIVAGFHRITHNLAQCCPQPWKNSLQKTLTVHGHCQQPGPLRACLTATTAQLLRPWTYLSRPWDFCPRAARAALRHRLQNAWCPANFAQCLPYTTAQGAKSVLASRYREQDLGCCTWSLKGVPLTLRHASSTHVECGLIEPFTWEAVCGYIIATHVRMAGTCTLAHTHAATRVGGQAGGQAGWQAGRQVLIPIIVIACQLTCFQPLDLHEWLFSYLP